MTVRPSPRETPSPAPRFPVCADLGLDPQIRARLPVTGTPARIAAIHRGGCVVLGDGPPRLVTLSGHLRHELAGTGIRPAVGDWIALARPGDVSIDAIAPRQGVIARTNAKSGEEQVLAANVDVAFIVTSANRDLSRRRLERFIALAAAGGVEAIVLLNKIDLADDREAAMTAAREGASGVASVLAISARDGEGIDAVRAALGARRTGVLLGTSGVGKSTLTNVLLGSDRQATAPIRAVDDRGRHTTVHRELFVLPDGGLLMDTPGLKLPRMTADAGAAPFDEIAQLEQSCRFRDCRHNGEPGCAVTAAIEDGRLDPARLHAARQLEGEAAWALDRADRSRAQTTRGRRGSTSSTSERLGE